MINIHQINYQRGLELLDSISICPRNKKVSGKATIEAVLNTEKLFESHSKIEKNISVVKSSEPSIISSSKHHNQKIILSCCYLCRSPDHFARDCPIRKRFEEETKRKLKNEAVARLNMCAGLIIA